jgi:uncharacterized SAM-binding protein YcdF (DUF218 family)
MEALVEAGWMTDVPRSNRLVRVLRALLWACAALAVAAALLYALRVPLLTALAGFLVVDQDLQPADLILVLNGEEETRPFYAGELYERGLAPRVAIARAEDSPAVQAGLFPNATDVALGILRAQGVPERDVAVLIVPGGVTSTRDEALALRQYVDEQGIERVIVVTSAFHTRRSRWILRKELAGSAVTLQLAAAPHWGFDAGSWWTDERGLIALVNEYFKMAYYVIKYR